MIYCTILKNVFVPNFFRKSACVPLSIGLSSELAAKLGDDPYFLRLSFKCKTEDGVKIRHQNNLKIFIYIYNNVTFLFYSTQARKKGFAPRDF